MRKERITLNLDKVTIEDVKKIAKSEKRTISNFMQVVLDNYIANYKQLHSIAIR